MLKMIILILVLAEFVPLEAGAILMLNSDIFANSDAEF